MPRIIILYCKYLPHTCSHRYQSGDYKWHLQAQPLTESWGALPKFKNRINSRTPRRMPTTFGVHREGSFGRVQRKRIFDLNKSRIFIKSSGYLKKNIKNNQDQVWLPKRFSCSPTCSFLLKELFSHCARPSHYKSYLQHTKVFLFNNFPPKI